MNKQQTLRLLKKAAAASEKAYAPYSNFHVGAAILTDDGSVFTGCNVENASYGLTNCAERTAVFSAVAAGQKKIAAVAIAAPQAVPYPCGACRQVLSEFGSPETLVFVAKTTRLSSFEQFTLGDLLPMNFKF
ncbi:MAG TPA: cytidine deaminase [Verrucomicrobia bacterium]|nr:MAG: cytidine deaminase [Lentisphaerae bacterium GWF2_57_35]HBA82603.1 cytidine deaminase [Verrucomicrobiota bacterium]